MMSPAALSARVGRRRTLRIAGRVAFVCVPIVSVGYLTGPAFVFAAVRLRSWLLGVAAAVYVGMTVAVCALPPDAPTSSVDGFLNVWLVVNIVLATVHAAFVQARLFPAQKQSATASDPAVVAALARRQRRLEARELLGRDPALAGELRIGRPDLARQFDDGGLIDVNRVPAQVLEQLPGLSAQHIEKIIAARQRPFGLTSVEDLIVYAEVPAEIAESLRDVLVFPGGGPSIS